MLYFGNFVKWFQCHLPPHKLAGIGSLPLVPKGRWRGEAVSEGIRTGDNRWLTTPQSRFASQLPFTGEPLTRAA